ncbi:ankyrin repeat domain-containing protein [Parashewanella curva]|uniref:Ankyrin repeat domain-containing protein n=1 Tax=Parashewanella curva TaxID=2338552 RepID=A0A3L8Q2C8_9GAMM|nr:ankyrin repeat domain-containing protein [Parashewanella curva]RLV61048.1 ankyrin repeat domain-containing protein [Parashewanella curva]
MSLGSRFTTSDTSPFAATPLTTNLISRVAELNETSEALTIGDTDFTVKQGKSGKFKVYMQGLHHNDIQTKSETPSASQRLKLRWIRHSPTYASNTVLTRHNKDPLIAARVKLKELENKLNSNHQALINSCRHGQLHSVQRLITQGVNLNITDQYGGSPLYYALQQGHIELANTLMEHGARLTADEQKQGVEQAFFDAIEANRLSSIQAFVRAGANVNAKNNLGNTPLGYAVCCQRPQIVRLLLANGAEVNARNNQTTTPLKYAVNKGDLKIVRLLLRSGANPNIRNQNGVSPLASASRHGHFEIMQLLLKAKADPNTQDASGKSPLYYAIQSNNIPALELLTSNGAFCSSHREQQAIAPHFIKAIKNYKSDLVEMCIKVGVDVNGVRNQEETPLIIAAGLGSSDVVKQLLDAGAVVDKQDKRGFTALQIAAKNGQLDIVKQLLLAKANTDIQTKDGWSALHYAAQNGHYPIVMKLVHSGAEVDIRSKDGKTLLFIAASNGHIDMVSLLLHNAAAANQSDCHGVTPLMAAAQNGCLATFNRLLGVITVNPNDRDKNGWTILHHAACHGHFDIVTEALKIVSTKNLKDTHGLTPLDLAKANGHTEIVTLLAEKLKD